MKTKILTVIIGVFLLGINLSIAQDQTTKTGQTPLKTSYVCMVNDSYMGREQIPVDFNGKIYYGCCPGCANNLRTNRSIRYAEDPVTGKEVDKADAYIVMKPNGSGDVLYFESEENYKKYKKSHSTPK